MCPVPGANRRCLIVELMNGTCVNKKGGPNAPGKTQHWKKKRFVVTREIREGPTEVVMCEGKTSREELMGFLGRGTTKL